MKWMTLLFTSLLALFLTACGEKEQRPLHLLPSPAVAMSFLTVSVYQALP
jgi:predicted small lipoprotein YifL